MLIDFVGNREVKRELEKNLTDGDISHAYLFVGSEGVGKFTLAKAFANKLATGPDLHIIRDLLKKEQIEQLIAESQKKPFAGDYKVFIIDDFEKMSIAGQNALLKTLEEPQEYLKIILIAKSTFSILPTIASRCRLIKFKDVYDGEIENFLRTNIGTDEKNAKLFSKISVGSVKRAINYATNPDAISFRDKSFEIIDRILNLSDVYREIPFFEENIDRIDEFFNIYSLFLKDVIIFNKNLDESLYVNVDKLAYVKKQNITTERALEIYKRIQKSKLYLQDNANFELVMIELLIGGI